MRYRKKSCVSSLGLALFVVLAFSGLAQAQWTGLANGISNHLDTCLLLTDGSVMCHEYGTSHWHRRTPDNTGSYQNGKWDDPVTIPDMPAASDTSNVAGTTCAPCAYQPTYFASAVLPDGRVVVIGGEYNTNSSATNPATATDTNIGYMYNPATNTWSAKLTEPFGTGNIGDSQSIILQNGTMLIANISNTNMASFDPSTLTFSALNPSGKLDRNDEEGWTILPSGKILTVDAGTANTSEIYDPVAKTWGTTALTQVSLTDLGGNCNSQEVGPAVMRPDGTIINFTGSPLGQNAVYNIAGNSWSHAASMDFPAISGAQYTAADAPASLLPDGHVLVMSSPGCTQVSTTPVKYTTFNKPSHFFELDLNNNLTQVTDSANAGSFISYQGRMLLLPSGEVLLTAFDQGSTDAVQLYSNGNAPQDAWRPIITSVPSILGLGDTYKVSGKQFNGFSAGATYGDDAQMATNFPLVRITDHDGHVFYAKTHDPSRMGVVTQPSNEVVFTNFDVPGNLATGTGSLVVVTNGIASNATPITVEPASAIVFSAGNHTTSDFNDATTVEAHLTAVSGGANISGKTVTFVLGSGTGTETCSATTTAVGLASCSITPNQAAGNYTLTATFASDADFAGSSVSTGFVITKEETEIAFTADNPTAEDYHDATTVKAHLTTDGIDLSGKTVTFKLGAGTGTETCSAVTTVAGIASCSITPNEAAGAYTLKVDFATDTFYLASSKSTSFTINKEETKTAFTMGSATVIPVGHSATLSAILTEDDNPPIVGRSVTITLGTGLGAQSCTGTSDATGKAECSIGVVNQPLGPNTVAASFAGDAFYLPSSASEAVILFAFLDRGSMEIGNLNAGTGSNVTFWGSQWTKVNSLSGGPVPDKFKGFADTAPQTCGGGLTSTPANSPGPPATVPSYMGVIASSSIVKNGNDISGNVPIIVVVKTNVGYGPSPEQTGTGTVVAVYCHP